MRSSKPPPAPGRLSCRTTNSACQPSAPVSSSSKENVRKSTTTSSSVQRSTTSSDATKLTATLGAKIGHKTPTKTLTVNTKWRNIKNVEDEEKALKAERTLLVSQLLVLTLIRTKTEVAVAQQRTEAKRLLNRLFRLVAQERRRRVQLCDQIDERRGWGNVAQATEQQAKALSEIRLEQLMQSLQTICAETEHKKATLPVEHLQGAHQIDDILTKINVDGSKREQQDALNDLCQAHHDMQMRLEQINRVLDESRQFSDSLIQVLTLQQQIETTDSDVQ